MQDVVIVAATRTAVGSFQNSLTGIPAPELSAAVIRRLLEQTGLGAGQVDEVIPGQVLTVGSGQNPARQAAIRASLSVGVPAMILSKACGSGLKALHLGVQAICCSGVEATVIGSQENMSLTPYVMPGARTGPRMGYAKLADSMTEDGLWDAFNDYHMGITAENLAEKYGLIREEQDTFAAALQRKAVAVIEGGRFRNEVTPIQASQHKGEPLNFDTNEQPRAGTIVEALAKLKPASRKDDSATVGNVPSLNDGAAVVLLMNAAKAKASGLPVLVRIANYAGAGVDPATTGVGPVSATRRALDRAGRGLEQLGLIETDEVLAAQSLVVGRELGWDAARINVNGGAIVLGYPIGVFGYRVLVTLLYEMIRRDARKDLATLCIGGGQGVVPTLVRD